MKKDSSLRASTSVLIGLAVASLAIILFAWLGEEVLDSEMARFDGTVREFVHKESSPHLTAAMRVFSDVGSPLAVAALTAAVCGVLWVRNRRRDAMVLSIVIVGASILDAVLKMTFRRVRPVPYFNVTTPTSFSFPSGHAMIAFCFYSAVAYLVSSRVKSLGLRVAIWIVAVSLFGLIGYSRIYLGVHYPTDVIAGYAAGAVWISAVMFERKRRWGKC